MISHAYLNERPRNAKTWYERQSGDWHANDRANVYVVFDSILSPYKYLYTEGTKGIPPPQHEDYVFGVKAPRVC